MINTYSESSLHKTLKSLYSLEKGFKTEVACNGKIYDIVDKKGNIIEIQTKNVSRLLDKTTDALEKGCKVKIVYPVILRKNIELYDSDGNRISKRKSPVQGSIYDMFHEITGLYPILLKKGFSLDVLEIILTEQRIRTGEPVQSPNGRRRFRRNWNKTDKKLEQIVHSHTFKKAEDYLALIPKECLPEFSAKELAESLQADKTLPSSAAHKAHLIIWVLSRMNLLQLKEIKNRSHYYCITGKSITPP
jgi:hypothetical protein